MNGHTVPFDAAGALWQFAARHPHDFLRGNHTPSLIEWARLLNYLRCICEWKLIVYVNGMENIHKAPENELRRITAEAARERNDLSRQIKNTLEYVAKVVNVCKFFNIEVRVAENEADP